MLLDLVFLAGGLALLVWSADQFVLGSARLAALLSLPPIVIGAVVMGFGTSAPELIVSSIAAAKDDRALGVGNIVGSNVANLSLVLGTAALLATMKISRDVVRREGPLALAAASLFAVFVVDGRLVRWEGAILLIGLVAIVVYLIKAGAETELDEVLDNDMSTPKEAGRALVGLIGTVVGAQLVVTGATDVADAWGVSGGFIGFSLVALGTSLPELVTTIACARRRETELIVGNLFGSNIFNALAVGGSMALIGPGVIGEDTLTKDGLILMLGVAIISFALALIGRALTRRDGMILVAMYVASMVWLGIATNGGNNDDTAAVGTPVSVVLAAA